MIDEISSNSKAAAPIALLRRGSAPRFRRRPPRPTIRSMKTHRSAARSVPPAFVDDYLSYLLAQASYAIYKAFEGEVRAAGLTSIEWRVLATLSDGDGRTIGELAARVLAQQPTLTKLVDRMAQAGLVERRGDDADGRLTRVHATARGLAKVAPLLQRAKAHERAALESFPHQEVAALKAMLRALAGAPRTAAPRRVRVAVRAPRRHTDTKPQRRSGGAR